MTAPKPDTGQLPAVYAVQSVARGAEAYALARLFTDALPVAPQAILYIAVNDRSAEALASRIPFFLPNARIVQIPSWDCLPYDRVSPQPAIAAARVQALSMLAGRVEKDRPLIILTTANAALQKLPPRDVMRQVHLDVTLTMTRRAALVEFLTRAGYRRTGKAIEPGEYAVRGGIIDVIPAGGAEGMRFDWFGEELESIRTFDPMTQTSSGTTDRVSLHAVSECLITQESAERFRTRYRELFGAVTKDDPLYESVSQDAFYPGMEHWIPLFYDHMETLFSYLPPNTLTVMEDQAEAALNERLTAIADYYDARLSMQKAKIKDAAVYHPLPPSMLYLADGEWEAALDVTSHALLSPFSDTFSGYQAVSLQTKTAVNLAAIRAQSDINAFAQLREHAAALREQGKATVLACQSNGSRERLTALLAEHGGHGVRIESEKDAKGLSGKSIGLAALPLEQGFVAPGIAYISERDLLGEFVIRSKAKSKRAEAVLAEAASFTEGELVVHREHGIGRFDGLVTLTVNDIPHDCLKLVYADDDKLFVPVENIEVLSRFGSEEEGVRLDKLGAASWQARKARMKQRIKIAAEALLKTAAERAMRTAPVLESMGNAYEAFAARFGHAETDDQQNAIEEVAADLQSGSPMDRLICGDVGFGKTEVALRAAFIAVNGGRWTVDGTQENNRPPPTAYRPPSTQVALVVPTTLLARQHYANFKKRFEGFNIRVAQLSRLVSAKEQRSVKEGLADGSVDIVIGTHALLSKSIQFKNLSLLIVDEEQHFGVGQKERLKELRAEVHVLTLTATPIPRTLQMAMSGLRSLSLIATPPVDRLAVRSYVMPVDPVVLREALLREKHRGGRVFAVVPRIKDLADTKIQLEQIAPELRIRTAHGQMPASELDTIMNDFYDGAFDLLLSTTIVESGLDIPQANTMLIFRADRFGLSQLYQLRGRVGRGKIRAYCYFLLPERKTLSKAATRRLEVMQTLDTLGAGFTLASHDMDIRGFGNLVGEEQSGHIREVGVELYQQMLAEAVEQLRVASRQSQEGTEQLTSDFSPQINLGLPVLIPEEYVADLSLRMALYKRAAHLENAGALDAFAAELVDRFGPLPQEVSHLLSVVRIKQACKRCGISRIDAGPNGAVMSFHPAHALDVQKLLAYITRNPTRLKLRPDGKMVLMREWKQVDAKIRDITETAEELATLR